MRKDVEFKTEDGVTLRGWLYLPDQSRGRVATIVMAHGFSAVKENYLDKYAEVYSAAGLGALVFDNRCFGASDGKPRQHIDPWRQVADYRDAITYASTLAEVDADRIGIWGSSYSGAHVLVVGALDRRVKCVTAQVPLISGHRNARRQATEQLVDFRHMLANRGNDLTIAIVGDESRGPVGFEQGVGGHAGLSQACDIEKVDYERETARASRRTNSCQPLQSLTHHPHHVIPTKKAANNSLKMLDHHPASFETAALRPPQDEELT